MKIMSLLSMLLVLSVCVGGMNLAKGDTGAILSIDPPFYEVAHGDIGSTFQINITVVNVTRLWSWKVRLGWNATVISLTDSPQMKEGSFLKSGGTTLFLWSQNQTAIDAGYIPEISCTLISTNGANGSGVLATVAFKSLSAGLSNISLNETVLLEPGPEVIPIIHTVLDGQVNVIPEFQHLVIILVMLSATSIAIFAKKRCCSGSRIE